MRVLVLFNLRSNGWRRDDVYAEHKDVGYGQVSAVVGRDLREALERWGEDAKLTVRVTSDVSEKV